MIMCMKFEFSVRWSVKVTSREDDTCVGASEGLDASRHQHVFIGGVLFWGWVAEPHLICISLEL